jgi:TRAP-type C4-dicarboxylate transport system permease small subunit
MGGAVDQSGSLARDNAPAGNQRWLLYISIALSCAFCAFLAWLVWQAFLAS